MIGSGIFASPGTAVDNSGSISAAIICWCIAGDITFLFYFVYFVLFISYSRSSFSSSFFLTF